MSSGGKFQDAFYNPSTTSVKPPFYKGDFFVVDGKLEKWNGSFTKIYSPIYDTTTNQRIQIGLTPEMSEADSKRAVEAAAKAWSNGLGMWPLCGVHKRIDTLTKFAEKLATMKDEIVELLMWEICKPKDDAIKEFERTTTYIKETISELKKMENAASSFEVIQGVIGHIRRAPLGTVLILGPFNYPFNETYANFIPALIMGNPVVLKLPTRGTLCHMPTLRLFAELFPPGVVNIVSGSGRSTIPPVMKTGKIDIFAFIGTSSAASAIIKDHPAPNRLRICLGLDAKNPAFVLPSADINVAINEILLGALGFNGQRCTAIKIVFVHRSIAETFVPKLCGAVDKLPMGLPWQEGVKITPLPESDKPEYLQKVIADAERYGAKVVNPRGNQFDRSFATPTVLYPVTKQMLCWKEEQFGPLVPVATFESQEDITNYFLDCEFGQQTSVFSQDAQEVGQLIDILVNSCCRVNINAQCQRGPDQYPFTGRKNSAAGTLSVHDALRVFSIRSMVATKENPANTKLINEVVAKGNSHFLRLDHIF